jgi:hypothetical protein
MPPFIFSGQSDIKNREITAQDAGFMTFLNEFIDNRGLNISDLRFCLNLVLLLRLKKKIDTDEDEENQKKKQHMTIFIKYCQSVKACTADA